MAESGAKIIAKFSDKVKKSQLKLEKYFDREIKQLLREISESDMTLSQKDDLIKELDTAKDKCDNYKLFLDNVQSQILESNLKIHKQKGIAVTKRANPGRDDRDSGVYSVDSRVLSTSNQLVTQPSDDNGGESTITVCSGQQDESNQETDA